ncbi:2-C-methyl-D-erythritol 2,4-cyclodiphosphate synthase [Patescibacteria group bacterium]
MNHVVILAAGKSERSKPVKNKLFFKILDQPLLYYPLMTFNDHPEIDTITVVANESNKKKINELIKKSKFSKIKAVILGGESRQKSVEKGVARLGRKYKDGDIVLIHNGANPFPSELEISKVIKKSKNQPCIVGRFATSTVKEVNKVRVLKTHDRKRIFKAETPQAASLGLFKKAIKKGNKNNVVVTDEAMLFEEIGEKVVYIKADENNFKISSKVDFKKAQSVLGEVHKDYLVGIGQDSHVFSEKKGLVLAGVLFKNENRLEANSDGDVILHAIFNAISQALGGASLGFYADSLCEKGVKDSRKYLEKVILKMKRKGYELNNLGLMIECREPRVDKISNQLKKSLSKLLDLPVHRIGITATSGENITEFGKGLGIQCFSIVGLKKSS